MKVRELVEWLRAFEDQDATVKVLWHESGSGYYDQGGNTYEVEFDPAEHAEYTDLRDNPYVKEPYLVGNHTLLLGSSDN